MAWYNTGNVLDDLGRYDEALIALDRALALDQNDAIAWTNKSLALRMLGRTAEAETAERRAKELCG